MAKGDYRWGNEATLVSGVAIAIAMVEKKKADAVARIAVSRQFYANEAPIDI